MKHENFAPPEYKEGLEADAVCGQCGNVNPEGTLICKMCGNNLRDQRMLRMAADQLLEAENEPTSRSVFLMRALPVLAILFVLWLGLNVGNISSMLMSADNATDETNTIYVNPESFWNGSESSIYDAMQTKLTARFPNESDAENARLNTRSTGSIREGRYVLYERMGTGIRYVGSAIIQMEGDVWHYNASLMDEIEIRGKASIFDQMLSSQWDQAGALYQGDYYAVTGTALAQPDGSISLNGESSHSMRRFSAVAYHYGDR
ncbi:MAG TPA: hypothetical protein ENN29_05360 [Candidatus Hydrogenedentes bacterium]|nr:hypothetical protein [Candidatus Hydrogenedentota bacterium]